MGFFRKMKQRITGVFRDSPYLCDSCKYDYGDACKRPERPNAKVCDDYKKK